MPRYRLKRLLFLLLLPISYLLVNWAKGNPEAVEEYYSKGFYHVLSSAINILTAFLSFSIAEILVVVAIVVALFYIISTVARIIRMHPKRRGYKIYVSTLNGAIIVSFIVFFFTISCGLNYYRIPFAEQCGLEVKEAEVDDLYELAVYLAGEANRGRELVDEDEDGIMVLGQGLHDADGTLELARRSLNEIAKDYPMLDGFYLQPKPVRMSRAMSYLGITGVFFPFTFEANVNVDVPDYTQPYTMAHELAHLRGFMQEEEANFIAYLACSYSDSDDFFYSGNMLALSYTLSALYRADSDKYFEVVDMLSEGVIRDRTHNAEYWAQFEGVAQDAATAVNNTYLKANAQESGTRSYGEMVDLLLAYRAKILEQEESFMSI